MGGAKGKARRIVGHGLDPSMDWIGLDWIGLGGMTVTTFFLISNHCSTVDAVSFKLRFKNFQLSRLPQLKVSIRIISDTSFTSLI